MQANHSLQALNDQDSYTRTYLVFHEMVAPRKAALQEEPQGPSWVQVMGMLQDMSIPRLALPTYAPQVASQEPTWCNSMSSSSTTSMTLTHDPPPPSFKIV